KKASQREAFCFGARDGDRTRTPPFGKRRILSPLCLPASPPGHGLIIVQATKRPRECGAAARRRALENSRPCRAAIITNGTVNGFSPHQASGRRRVTR